MKRNSSLWGTQKDNEVSDSKTCAKSSYPLKKPASLYLSATDVLVSWIFSVKHWLHFGNGLRVLLESEIVGGAKQPWVERINDRKSSSEVGRALKLFLQVLMDY